MPRTKPISWHESDWRSVWWPDGARWIGYGYGGEWVQLDGRIELRFPMCHACNVYCKTKERRQAEAQMATVATGTAIPGDVLVTNRKGQDELFTVVRYDPDGVPVIRRGTTGMEYRLSNKENQS